MPNVKLMLWSVALASQFGLAQANTNKTILVDEGGVAYIVSFESGNIETLPEKSVSQAMISSDSQYAVINSTRGTVLVHLSDGAMEVLSPSPFNGAVWSADGNKLVFLQYVAKDSKYFETVIFVWDMADKIIRRVK